MNREKAGENRLVVHLAPARDDERKTARNSKRNSKRQTARKGQ